MKLMKMKIKLEDNLVLQELRQDIYTIPPFINGKSFLHKEIYNQLQIILRIFGRILRNDILSKSQLKSISDDMDAHIENLATMITNLKTKDIDVMEFEITMYLETLLSKYKEIAIENEMYEVAENIKKFSEY